MEAIENRILILDGAMGTMLQKLGDSSDEAIEKVHRLYIEAGADIIETNSFNLKGYDDSRHYAELARKVADEAGRKVFVAGSLGPFNKMLSMSDDANHPENRSVSFEELAAIYRENAAGLIDGGVDALLLETVFDPLNAKAALHAMVSLFEERGRKLPIMVSATLNDRYGHLLTGISIEDFYDIVEPFGIWSFGLNCSFGAEEMAPVIDRISKKVSCRVSMHPNAGLPDQTGGYSQTPKQMAAIIKSIAAKGCLNIVGGCCGTTPEHIKAISTAIKGIEPKKISRPGLSKKFFINVGERTNVAGSRKFAKLIAAGNYEEAATIARNQVENGASVIDINMDDPLLDAPLQMEKFIRYISNDPVIANTSMMIDSSDWTAIRKGLQNAPGKVIVNSISLKEGEDAFLEKARELQFYGASAVVMAFDEEGQATTLERKKEIFQRSYNLLTKQAGFEPERIILDGNILTIATGMAEDASYAVDFIEAVRWAKKNLSGVLTSGGVSNLSFAFRGNNTVREAMHTVFLYHATKAGLDMAIVNPSMLKPYNSIERKLLKAVEDVVLNKDSGATERLVAIAGKYAGTKETENSGLVWRDLPCEERLKYALINGNGNFLQEDLTEALKSRSAIEIVEETLLAAMEEVGTMFGQGKMFLPQVVRTARTMKAATAILQPYIAESGNQSSKKKKFLLATVKGDVHDIGKNILSIVLSCNGMDVIDLGVMVDNETILEAIHREKPDYVGVSGLIAPSLKEMEALAGLMEEQELNIPLFIGGATTSALHTALYIAPKYSGCTIYTGSASECAETASRLSRNPEETIHDILAEREMLIKLHNSSRETFFTIEEARAKAPVRSPFRATFGNDILETNIQINQVRQFIDWRMFLAFWEFKDPTTIEAKKCLEEGQKYIENLYNVEISMCLKFFDAKRHNEDLTIADETFNLGRSTSNLTECSSYADFLPEDGGRCGLFVIKVEDHHACCNCMDYEAMMRKSLCARLAEAAADRMQTLLPEHCIRPAFGYPSCPDHTLKRKAFKLLDAESLLGLHLTESCAMIPETSICGMVICHPDATYINYRSNL